MCKESIKFSSNNEVQKQLEKNSNSYFKLQKFSLQLRYSLTSFSCVSSVQLVFEIDALEVSIGLSHVEGMFRFGVMGGKNLASFLESYECFKK